MEENAGKSNKDEEIFELNAKRFVSDISDFFEGLISKSYLSLSKNLLLLYSGTILLFLINYGALANVSGEGPVLWPSILIIFSLLRESFVYLILLSKGKLGYVFDDVTKRFDKYEDKVPDGMKKKYAEYVLYELEELQVIKEMVTDVKNLYSPKKNKGEDRFDLSKALEMYESVKSPGKSKTLHILNYLATNEIPLELSNKSKKETDSTYKSIKKKMGASFISLLIYSIAILLFTISIIINKFNVLFSWFM